MHLYIKSKTHLALTLVLALLLFQASCKKDSEGAAIPTITGLRANTPAPNDSVLTRALPGQTVIVQGTGLGNTQVVYFNGQPIPFNAALQTDKSIIATIPADMPFGILKAEDLNKIKVVTKNGETSFTFPIVPPAPALSSIDNEFASPGSTIELKGQYLYLLKKIVFPGGIEATEFTGSSDGLTATVKVPAGATQPGALIISNNGGTSTSAPLVTWHDASQAFFNMDDKNAFAPWGALPVLTESHPTINPYSGQFLYWNLSNVTPGTWWCQDLATPTDAAKLAHTTAIPDTEPISNLALKFEINVPGEGLKAGRFEFNFNWQYTSYWTPALTATFKTVGWKTITIPMNTFSGGAATYKDIKGKSFNIFFVNGDGKVATNVDLAWDNFRIVKMK